MADREPKLRGTGAPPVPIHSHIGPLPAGQYVQDCDACWIDQCVAEAPPLSDAQLDRLARLFRL